MHNSSTIWSAVAAICLVAGLVAPGEGFAQENCPAADWVRVVELSRKAKDALDADRFVDSLALLQAAYQICPEPKLHRSMGRVHEEAGDLALALQEYRACGRDTADVAVRNDCLGKADLVSALIAQRAIQPPQPADQSAPDVPTDTPTDAPADASPASTNDVASPVNDASSQGLTAPVEVPTSHVKAGPGAPETAGNWVGIALGTAAVGVGVAFFAQYGMDLAAAQPMHYDPEAGGWWAADEVGPRNLALGASFTAAGLLAVILSATLWPDAPVTISATPVEGGGIVGFQVGMR